MNSRTNEISPVNFGYKKKANLGQTLMEVIGKT